MALHLAIENETSLPDGGPLSISVSGKRGLDIGRDQHLDWTLPDTTHTISGKHCEIRYQDGGYWLHDVSTNGTYLNGSDCRLQGPHRLCNGDRLEIGHYIISVALDGDERSDRADAGGESVEQVSPGSAGGFWNVASEVPPPLQRRDFQPPGASAPVHSSFLDWAIEPPTPIRGEQLPPSNQPESWTDDMTWAEGYQPMPIPDDPNPPAPVPRRPRLTASLDPNPWMSSAPADKRAVPEIKADPTQAASASSDFEVFHSPNTRAEEGPPILGAEEVLRCFAKGAGIPEDVISWRDPGEFAELIGGIMRIVAEDLKQLLAARAESKRITRSSSHTIVQALDNNPLKFSPTPEDGLRLMFGRPTSSYLDARRTMEQSFRDLKIHQIKTYSAMQAALRLLIEDMDPKAIDESVASDTGLSALVSSRKAKLWDAFVARWNAKTAMHEDGLVDAFMLYFAQCYDGSGTKTE